MFLPEGEDPDTLVRRVGAVEFADRIGQAQHLSSFFFERLGAGLDLASLDGRARLAEHARPLLDRLPAGVYRDLMIASLAELTKLPPTRLGLRGVRRPARYGPSSRRPHQPPRTLRQWAIAILLQHPELATGATSVPDAWRRLEDPGVQLLRELLDLMLSQPNLKTASLIERWRGSPAEKHLNTLACADLSGAVAGLEQELAGALGGLNREAKEKRRDEVLAVAYTPSRMSDQEKAQFRALFEDQAPPNPGGS
jgi:DNA primase